ncbi:MAG: hypothetical protein PUB69_00530 [Desulfovibrionaceae bacterium]|nr:hypothetical protein [Desulfovibrionaceae bacterium]
MLSRYLSWMPDRNGSLSFEDAAKKPSAAFIRNDSGQIPRSSGTIWFRLAFGDLPEAAISSKSLRLDLGPRFFGMLPSQSEVRLFSPAHPKGTELLYEEHGLYRLPETLPRDAILLIRSSGLTGFAFSPLLTVRKSGSVPGGSAAIFFGLGLFAVAVAGCFLRMAADRCGWRLWLCVYASTSFFCVLSGMPNAEKGFISGYDLLNLLAPSLVVLALAHLVRLFLRTRDFAPLIDIHLILLSLPAVLFAIAPLFPGYTWLLRYRPLWPMMIFCLIPTVFYLVMKAYPGAIRILILLLLPPAGLIGFAFAGGSYANLGLILPSVFLLAAIFWGLFITTPALPHTPNTVRKSDKESSGLHWSDPAQAPQKAAPANLSLTSLNGAAQKAVREVSYPVNELTDQPAVIEPFSMPGILETVRTNLDLLAHSRNNTLILECAAADHEFSGPKADIIQVLTLLAESALLMSEYSEVRIRIEQANRSDPDHVRFRVIDFASGSRSAKRSALAAEKLQDLVNRCAGTIYIAIGDTGTEASFSLRLPGISPTAPEPYISASPNAAAAETKASSRKRTERNRILLIGGNEKNMKDLRSVLQSLPYVLTEVPAVQSAADVYASRPASLLIFSNGSDREGIARAIERIRIFETIEDLSMTSTLAVTENQDQTDQLALSGCSNAIAPQDINTDVLGRMIARLTPMPRPRETDHSAIPEKQTVSAPAQGSRLTQHRSDESRSPENGSKSVIGKLSSILHRKKDEHLPLEQAADSAISDRKQTAPDSPIPAPKPRPDFRAGYRITHRSDPESLRRIPAVSMAPADATEWVGEPQPILKTPTVSQNTERSNSEQLEKRPSVQAASSPVVQKIPSIRQNTLLKSDIPAEKPAVSDAPAPTSDAPAPTNVSAATGSNEPNPSVSLDEAFLQVETGFRNQDASATRNGIASLLNLAEAFGLRDLQDSVLCVEQALSENDMETVQQVMKDLQSAIDHNKVHFCSKQE